MRALVHFWDPDYRCFSFRSINLCPNIGCWLSFQAICIGFIFLWDLTRSPPNYQNCSELPTWKSFWKKNGTGLKWRMLEIELKKRSGSEREYIWPYVVPRPDECSEFGGRYYLCRVWEYTNQSSGFFNLAETIVTLNHCRKTGKGAMRQLLYI